MNREALLNKIRALMSKTVDRGCSEHEALAALAKAQAMMDAYEVTEADLQLSKAEAAMLREDTERDPHGIKTYLIMAVAEFTDTKCWKAPTGLVFCGLPSDVQFAHWLADSLRVFVLGELTNYLATLVVPKGDRRRYINGFCMGATSRISNRLHTLVRESKAKQATASNSRALVVVKDAAIKSFLDENNIRLRTGRRSSKRSDASARAAGQAAGDRASFGRPVGGGQALIGG